MIGLTVRLISFLAIAASVAQCQVYCSTETLTGYRHKNYTTTTTITYYSTTTDIIVASTVSTQTLLGTYVAVAATATSTSTIYTTIAGTTVTIPTSKHFTPFTSASANLSRTVGPSESDNGAKRIKLQTQGPDVASSKSSNPVKTSSCLRTSSRVAKCPGPASHVHCTTYASPSGTETVYSTHTSYVEVTGTTPGTYTTTNTVTTTVHTTVHTNTATVYEACLEQLPKGGSKWKGKQLHGSYYDNIYQLPNPDPDLLPGKPSDYQAGAQGPFECCQAVYHLAEQPCVPNTVYAFEFAGATNLNPYPFCGAYLADGESQPDKIYFWSGAYSVSPVYLGSVAEDPPYVFEGYCAPSPDEECPLYS